MIEPSYLNLSTFGIIMPSTVTSPLTSALLLKQQ